MKRTSLVLALALAAMPLAAQQATSNAPVSGRDKGNMEHREGSAKNDTVTTGAAAKEKAKAHNQRVWEDVTRLAGLLRDVQTEVSVSAAAWRTIANEANVLANRIYARATPQQARAAATELRMHVREMRTAAMRGDAANARRHAAEALPAAYRLIDWVA